MADIKTSDGYMKRFWELAQERRESRTMMSDALRSLESELCERHGVRRYSNYKSFSAAKSRGKNGIRVRPV